MILSIYSVDGVEVGSKSCGCDYVVSSRSSCSGSMLSFPVMLDFGLRTFFGLELWSFKILVGS